MKTLWAILILSIGVAYLIGLRMESAYRTWDVDRHMNLILAPPEMHKQIEKNKGV